MQDIEGNWDTSCCHQRAIRKCEKTLNLIWCCLNACLVIGFDALRCRKSLSESISARPLTSIAIHCVRQLTQGNNGWLAEEYATVMSRLAFALTSASDSYTFCSHLSWATLGVQEVIHSLTIVKMSVNSKWCWSCMITLPKIKLTDEEEVCQPTVVPWQSRLLLWGLRQ